MKTKKELLEHVLNNPSYKAAISSLSPEEKKKIESILFGDLLNMIHAFHAQIHSLEKDPDASNKLIEEFNKRKDISNLKKEETEDANGST